MRRVNDEVLANDNLIVLSEECMYVVEGGACTCNNANHYHMIGGVKLHGGNCSSCGYGFF